MSRFCGETDTCSNWLRKSYPNYFYFTYTYGRYFYLVKGYNKIILPSIVQGKKGQMLRIFTTIPNLLAIDTSNDPSLFDSDYHIYNYKMTKLNSDSKWRFYANVLIEGIYYKSVENISLYFTDTENVMDGLTSKFVNSNISLTRKFNVSSISKRGFFLK